MLFIEVLFVSIVFIVIKLTKICKFILIVIWLGKQQQRKQSK